MQPANDPSAADRTTESALDMPSVGRVLRIAGRALRLRCPNCGRGPILESYNVVHGHCSACGFRYARSDDDYFSGAMFFGMLIGETLAVLGIVGVVIASWPDVPWKFLQFGGPIILLAVMLLLFPFSRVAWLAVDVLVRPVEASECVLTPLVPAVGIGG